MSPCPAIPTTKVAKSNGATIILTMFRKIVASGASFTEKSGANQPQTTPKKSAIKIYVVNLVVFKIFFLTISFLLNYTANMRKINKF